MIVLGIGNDLIDITRIETVLKRFGTRFIERVFTEAEQHKAEGRAQRAATYAKRYAAKEACAKALGTGFRDGVYWRDIGVTNLPSGEPTLELSGGAKARLESMLPAGMVPKIFLTLTDEPPLAQAFVLIAAVPGGTAAP